LNTPRTLGEALSLGRKALKTCSENPRLEARVLLASILQQPQVSILTHPETPLHPTQARRFLDALQAYQSGQALPYLVGQWEFYGRRFRIHPAVLIPRPETELLVELALDSLGTHPEWTLVADVGTGSGCIAITLAAERVGFDLVATDLSYPALQLARDNAVLHGVQTRIDFVQCDLLGAIAEPFGLICANLPYVWSDDLDHLSISKREPRLALDGGSEGLEIIDALLRSLPDMLKPNGRALLEIGSGQAKPVMDRVGAQLPGWPCAIRKDFSEMDRILILDRPEGDS
jgi:release factor glutamine methyltransferase